MAKMKFYNSNLEILTDNGEYISIERDGMEDYNVADVVANLMETKNVSEAEASEIADAMLAHEWITE